MLYIVLFFLLFSLFLYVVLGGADYGAGIVELFSSKENQEITKKKLYRVMGPVWEANHIWIIIVIVILWVAFPKYYNIMVVYLHIPLTIMLLGVTLRGVAFVFRHYDAVVDNSQRLYDAMFTFSSLVTPIFLGMLYGALSSGKIILTDDISTLSFYQAFVAPWCNVFSILIGLFFAALCAFLSSVLLIGESEKSIAPIYIRKSVRSAIVVFSIGGLTFIYGYLFECAFVLEFLENAYALGILGCSSILILPLWRAIRKGRTILSRVYAVAQVFLIVSAAIVAHFPNMIITSNSEISIFEDQVPDSVFTTLGICLLIGGVVILPGVFHLMNSFKMIKILDRNHTSV